MLYDNKLWIKDINKGLEIVPELDQLTGQCVLITGAAGLICSAIVDILFRYNDTHEKTIYIYAAGRSIEKMESRFGSMIYRPDFTFVQYDATKEDNQLNFKADYIIHGATNASPLLISNEPAETMLSNFEGMKCLLNYAKEQRTKRVLYISSSEVYGQKYKNQPFKENEYGFVDLLNPRNVYSIGKRAAETLCVAYAYEYGVESVIVRPGHIYGPTATERDTRVSSAWAYDVAKGHDIIMKSNGTQLRSYCYCLDCATAILKVMIKGKNINAYNISNPDSIISIRELATILTEVTKVNLRIELPTEMEKKSFNPMSNSSLDSEKLLALGWKGCFDALTGLTHTVQILKKIST